MLMEQCKGGDTVACYQLSLFVYGVPTRMSAMEH